MRISDCISDVCSSDLLVRNCRVVCVNRGHVDWYGLEASAFIGKTFIEVFGEQASRDPAVDELVKRGHAGGRGSVRSWVPQAGRWTQVSVVPDGADGIYMLMVAVSELKAAQDEL